MRRHQSGTSKARPSWPFSRNRVTRHAGAGPGLRLKTAWLARGRRRWRLGRAGAVAVAFGPLVPQLSRWAPRPPNPFAAALPRFCPRAGTSCTRPPRGREPHSRVAKSLSRVVGARAAHTRRCGPLKRSRLRLGKQQAGRKRMRLIHPRAQTLMMHSHSPTKICMPGRGSDGTGRPAAGQITRWCGPPTQGRGLPRRRWPCPPRCGPLPPLRQWGRPLRQRSAWGRW